MSITVGHEQEGTFTLGHHAEMRRVIKTAVVFLAGASAALIGLPVLALLMSYATGGGATAELLYAFLGTAFGMVLPVAGLLALAAMGLALPLFFERAHH